MISRRRKKAPISKCILFICSIVVLNLAGISYAYWNSGMNIMMLVSTGDLDVRFDPNTSYELVKGNGDLTVKLLDEKTIMVEGTVEEAVSEEIVETDEATIISPAYSDYEGLLEFNIINKGRIPAELVNNTLENESGSVLANVNSQGGLLYPLDYNLGNSISQELRIQAGAEEGNNTINFEAELLFNQPK